MKLSDVRLSIGLQHHPSRAHLIERLTNLGSVVQVVPDPDPDSRIKSAWRTYRRVLETTPEWATHRLVLQDDAEVCPGFLSALQSAIEARPDRMVCLFVPTTLRRGGSNLIRACQEDKAWSELFMGEWVPVVALVWPSTYIAPFLEWASEKGYGDRYVRADDAIVGNYCKHIRQPPLATVPSLVEHPDEEPSLVGNRISARRARCYVGDEAHLIDWSAW